ncbi:MAG TPA: general stress protein [Herpetosiphon sp.]|nr:general stress protein [Herpetosiphon sp.]
MEDTAMQDQTTTQQNISKVAEQLKGFKLAMLTTVASDNSLHSRPMVVQQKEFDGDLWFMTGRDSGKIAELSQSKQVNVAFVDVDDSRYVSLSGTGQIVDDRAKIKELWTPLAKAWFKDENDPNIVLIKVEPQIVEYWDTPNSTFVQVAGFLSALVTGERPEIGEHGKVKL